MLEALKSEMRPRRKAKVEWGSDKEVKMAGITWLHLSDWHQRGKEFDRLVVRDALIEDIRNRERIAPELKRIDFIIMSGDVSFSGKSEEYEAAWENLFEPVLNVTDLRAERLFFVPGNHDLDRSEFELLPGAILQPFKSNEQINEWLTNQKKRDRLLTPFQAYKQFVARHTAQTDPDYDSIRKLNINGIQVALLGLNSALMCGRNKNNRGEVDDKGNITLGEPQIYKSLKQIKSAHIRIAVMHHPFDWLAEFDRHRIDERLKKDFQFILYGHQHSPNFMSIQSAGGQYIIIPAGASYDRRSADNLRYANAYNFVHLDIEIEKDKNQVRGQGKVHLRRWFDERSKWNEDIVTADHGLIEFECPPKKFTPLHIQEPSIPRDLETHYEMLSYFLTQGSVVPFLGADINLCDRLDDELSTPWDWQPEGNYPPTSTEVAAYLRGRECLQDIRCPLTNKDLPSQCPINTAIVNSIDLQNVSQYFDLRFGGEQLKEAINKIYNHDYKPNRLHKLLANLPRLMSEKGYPSPYKAIVTANFDRTLELAFKEVLQPFDLVSYVNTEMKFVYQRFDLQRDENTGIEQIVEKGQPDLILDPNEDKGLQPENYPIILKLYGPADWEEGQAENFAITEDHFINYLAHTRISQLIPKTVFSILRNSNIWFLGYSLSYWHLRVILNRIWPYLTGRNYPWWAIQANPRILDDKIWKANHVELIRDISLDNYVTNLDKYVIKLKDQLKDMSPRSRGHGRY